jgi:hypothetical protein
MNITAEVAELRRRRADRPLPTVRVEHGRSVPAGVLRLAAAAAVPALLLLAGLRTGLMSEVVLVVAGAFGVWAAWRPGPAAPHLAVLLAGLSLLATGSASLDPVLLWLVPAAYATVRLGWWAEVARPRARVELDVLRRGAGRDLVVLAVTAVLGGAGWLAAGAAVGGLVLLGGAALLALAWSLLPR